MVFGVLNAVLNAETSLPGLRRNSERCPLALRDSSPLSERQRSYLTWRRTTCVLAAMAATGAPSYLASGLNRSHKIAVRELIKHALCLDFVQGFGFYEERGDAVVGKGVWRDLGEYVARCKEAQDSG
jgi:hypothetical protein